MVWRVDYFDLALFLFSRLILFLRHFARIVYKITTVIRIVIVANNYYILLIDVLNVIR